MKKNNLVYILILIMPIIDLLSSIITRNFTNSITIGIVIKTALIMISFIYVFFFSHSKYKRKSVIYYIFLIYMFFSIKRIGVLPFNNYLILLNFKLTILST